MTDTLRAAEKKLETLHTKIWKKDRISHLVPGMCIRPGKDFKNPNKIRDLTEKEIELVFNLARNHNFPATIISSFNGASFSLRIYSNHGRPTRRLITIESSQFPKNGGKTEDERVYGLMFLLAGSSSNLSLIETHQITGPANYSACIF